VNFEQFQVFQDASITSGIFIFNFFNKEYNNVSTVTFKEKKYAVDEVAAYINDDTNYFNVALKPNTVFALIDAKTQVLNKKIDGAYKRLDELLLVGRGMETGKNDIFIFDKIPEGFPEEFFRKRISGENICAYFSDEKYDYVLFIENVDDFNELPQSIRNYLEANKKSLANRADKKRRKTALWWNWTFALHHEHYKLPKIVCSYRNSTNQFFLDKSADNICLSNMTLIFGTNETINLKYILAILNSRLFHFRYSSIGKQTGGGSFEYMPNGIGKFPIPVLDLGKQSDKDQHDHFVSIVDQMLDLKQREQAATLPQAKAMISRQIAALDKQIDEAVYGLYGLTEKEIKTVEGEQ
jgi:hypothetical protein